MNVIFLMGLLAGIFVTLFSQYLLQKSKDSRNSAEHHQSKMDEWTTLFNSHPTFFNHIKNDINDPIYHNIREFFVVEKIALMNSFIPRLRYDLTEDIVPVLNKLESLGYIEKLPNISLLYKIHDSFIIQLKSVKTPL